MSDQPIAIVALSGGMDSCVTAAIAAEHYSIALLHAQYGQRTAAREKKSFEAIADFYNVPQNMRLIAEMPWLSKIGGSSLTDQKLEMRMSGHIGKTIPNTYVPFRNTHLLSIAVSWAEVIGAKAAYLGAVAGDSSGYPDCRPEFFDAFRMVVRTGTKPDTHISIETPLINLSKGEIVRRGVELGAPLELTWSCYRGTSKACGKCDSCILRLKGFREAGVTDPIQYEK